LARHFVQDKVSAQDGLRRKCSDCCVIDRSRPPDLKNKQKRQTFRLTSPADSSQDICNAVAKHVISPSTTGFPGLSLDVKT